MVSKGLAGILGLGLSLASCSSDSSQSPKPSYSFDFEASRGELYGKRVEMIYGTNDGPRSADKPYSRARSTEPEFVDGVHTALGGIRSYVLPVGIFHENYGAHINLSGAPVSRRNEWDVMVIADSNFDLSSLSPDVKEVYATIRVPDTNTYKLQKVSN